MTATARSSLDQQRIEFLHPLTPRQAALLHQMWGLAADALTGDLMMFDTRLRWLDAYTREMRAVPDGQRQLNLITARITGIAEQLTPAERRELHVVVAHDPGAEIKCIRCGCTEERACAGGCSWASVHPPICTECV